MTTMSCCGHAEHPDAQLQEQTQKALPSRVLHDGVGVLGVIVVPHHGGTEPDQALHLLGRVVGVEIQVHLVATDDRGLGDLEGKVHAVPAEHPKTPLLGQRAGLEP
jgi:hypothetical protein